ncbi:hypothetical protein C0992_012433 [Termitomyces sp. T32_za158]|nr:hypothetical protein C0992_012433 [Termitomyces sp. T32_za158]
MLLALNLLCVTAVVFAFQGGYARVQTALNVQASGRYDGYAPGHDLSKIMHLSNIGLHEFTTLSHPRFPNHQVRLKKSHFCDPTVNVFTGYLDVDAGAKHLFFYFFESRRDPAKDDVMMWINGGTYILENHDNKTVYEQKLRPRLLLLHGFAYGTRRVSSVGVGFSYADFGEKIETTEDAAKNVHAFITIFFETFEQFSGRPLHLSGESYGVWTLVRRFREIYDQNQIAIQEGRMPLNLQSVLIGNGITDISTLYPGRYEVECGTASLNVPFQSINACVRMKTVPCEGELCYAENDVIKRYLDLPETRALLGVESPSNFSACSSVVNQGFNDHMDKWASPTQYYVSNLLDRGVRILIYAGTYDWQCNWVANKLWVDKLEWSRSEVYKAQGWRNWEVDGKVVGEVKSSELLTFATIRGAGHMISTAFLLIVFQAKTYVDSTYHLTSLRNPCIWFEDG